VLAEIVRVSEVAPQAAWWVMAQVSADPSSEGLPGAGFLQRLLDWTGMLGLFLGLGSVLLGGGLWAIAQHGGNQYGASAGRKAVLGGALAAVLVGLGPELVNGLYQAARG